MDVADEQQILQQAQQGDEIAFGVLVRQYQTAVFNVAYRLLGRSQDAEDMTQEAFVRAFQALDRFDTERPFAPWIKRIVTNLCYNWLASARVKTTDAVTDLETDPTTAMGMDRWQAATPTPEQTITVSEREQLIRQAILKLPPHYRAVIELRHFQGLAYSEIAEVLQRPLSDVKSDLFRARKLLAQDLRGKM